MPSHTETRKTYTVDETAGILGLGRNTTYQFVKEGRIPCIRVGRRILVPRAAIEQMLKGEAN